MKPQINLYNFNLKSDIQQIKVKFHFHTKAHWEDFKTKSQPNFEAFFKAEAQQVFVETNTSHTIYHIGLGDDQKPSASYQKISSKFAFDYKDTFLHHEVALEFNTPQSLISDVFKGLYLGTYQYPFEFKHPFWNAQFKWFLDEKYGVQVDTLASETLALCIGQFTAMDWLNKPANAKNNLQFSNTVEKLAEKYQWKYQKFDFETCEKLGLGAFAAVAQAQKSEAAFTILEYHGGDAQSKTVGLIGKSVLFDTGGISIKPSDNMHYMKSDMGGGTAVLGTMIAISELQIPINVIAILPITDNLVSETAYLPSDVIKAYNGKTIEVLNTDAEGRMTLADALAYMVKNYSTDVLIDLATLTGSAVRMFGYSCGAMFSNDEKLKAQIEKAAHESQQKVWNLPLWDEWNDEIKSDVADFKNISMKPFGDCIVAAKFLEHFIHEHPSWAHLDIAGVAFGSVPYAKEKAATGYGVQLLLNLIYQYI